MQQIQFNERKSIIRQLVGKLFPLEVELKGEDLPPGN